MAVRLLLASIEQLDGLLPRYLPIRGFMRSHTDQIVVINPLIEESSSVACELPFVGWRRQGSWSQ